MLFIDQTEVDRFVCCNVREKNAEKALKKFRVIAEIHLSEVEQENENILSLWNW